VPENTGRKPDTLTVPRPEGPDDLKKIRGIGPKVEKLLNSLGFFHYDQIAEWTDADIAWVDENLETFRGRAARDRWVEQASALAKGETSGA
jgi:NADH-quinone oxidoreductase subunit E